MTNDVAVIKITEEDMVGAYSWIPPSRRNSNGIFSIDIRDTVDFPRYDTVLAQITLPAFGWINKLFTVLPNTGGDTYVTFETLDVLNNTPTAMPLRRIGSGKIGVRTRPEVGTNAFKRAAARFEVGKPLDEMNSIYDFMARAKHDRMEDRRAADVYALKNQLKIIDEATTSEEHKKAEQDLETLKQEINDRHFNNTKES